MNYYFLARATDPQHAKAVRNGLDFQSGAVFSAVVVKGGDPHAQAVALEAIKFTGRTRLIIMCDEEKAVKNLVDMVRDSRTHETAVTNTPTRSSASADGIERANCEVEKTDTHLEITVRRELWGVRGFGPQGVAVLGAAQCVAAHAVSGEV